MVGNIWKTKASVPPLILQLPLDFCLYEWAFPVITVICVGLHGVHKSTMGLDRGCVLTPTSTAHPSFGTHKTRQAPQRTLCARLSPMHGCPSLHEHVYKHQDL